MVRCGYSFNKEKIKNSAGSKPDYTTYSAGVFNFVKTVDK